MEISPSAEIEPYLGKYPVTISRSISFEIRNTMEISPSADIEPYLGKFAVTISRSISFRDKKYNGDIAFGDTISQSIS